ncbi:MAG: DUF1501 domain-containing protein [Acidovorax sp.]
MQRRTLLHTLAALPVLATRAWAAPTQGNAKLLVVFLRGAYDCTSLLVPTARAPRDFYAASRPNIAIQNPSPLDADWGLHPAVADALLPLYERRQLAFLPFAGIDDLSRSHFETQDAIELGQPQNARRDYGSGFLNRLAAVLGAQASPMAFTDQMPISLRGPAPAANMALTAVGKPAVSEQGSRVITGMYRGTPLAAPVAEGFSVRGEVLRSLNAEMQAASRNAMNTRGFEQVARRMAELMKSRFDLGFVDVGGWDTHVGQGSDTGYLANRLAELGQGLTGFADALGPEAWRNTVVVVVSEFGRTFRENGNRGTDHGHGSVYWLAGGALSAQAGGRVLGEQVTLSQATLFQNRDYPVLNEYRAVLGGLFTRLYGLSPAQVGQVFAGVKPVDLKII